MLSIRWIKTETGRPVATWTTRGPDTSTLPKAASPAIPSIRDAACLNLRRAA